MADELQGLVVEDEFLVALDIELMLQESGGAVVGPIGDRASALRTAQDGGFDRALLELDLGGEPVTAVAETLLAQALPMIFCTGYQAGNLPDRFAGAPTLRKPFQAGDVGAALRTAAGDGTT